MLNTFILWLLPMLLAPTPPATSGMCLINDYYEIDLVTTKRVTGSGNAKGIGKVAYLSSPFGISMTADGSYAYQLDVIIDRLAPARSGKYVVWVTTPDIDHIKLIGELNDDHQIKGKVDWNKFLVVITLEPDGPVADNQWKGPVVLRGVSRSGLMHTMAGHGPYEQEPCAIYGY